MDVVSPPASSVPQGDTEFPLRDLIAICEKVANCLRVTTGVALKTQQDCKAFLKQYVGGGRIRDIIENKERESAPYRDQPELLGDLQKLHDRLYTRHPQQKQYDFVIIGGGQCITICENLMMLRRLYEMEFKFEKTYMSSHVYHSFPTAEQLNLCIAHFRDWVSGSEKGLTRNINEYLRNLCQFAPYLKNDERQSAALKSLFDDVIKRGGGQNDVMRAFAMAFPEPKLHPFIKNDDDQYALWFLSRLAKDFGRPARGLCLSTRPGQFQAQFDRVFKGSAFSVECCWFPTEGIEALKSNYFNELPEVQIRFALFDLEKCLVDQSSP